MIPFAAAASYPRCREVKFRCAVPPEERNKPRGIATAFHFLKGLRHADWAFARQLKQDGILCEVYKRVRQNTLPQAAMTGYVRSIILTIERALRLRMQFAEYQYHCVQDRLAYVPNEVSVVVWSVWDGRACNTLSHHFT